MNERPPPYLHTIQAFWDTAQPKAAGMAIFERVPRTLRPRWAAASLRFAAALMDAHLSRADQALLARVLAFAEMDTPPSDRDDAAADAAHAVFDHVRRYTLAHAPAASPARQGLFHLAENVVKVSYTAYGFPRPFDHDAGWWVVITLHQIVTPLADPPTAARALACLTAPSYLQLTHPIRCHPDCATCAWLATFEEVAEPPINRIAAAND